MRLLSANQGVGLMRGDAGRSLHDPLTGIRPLHRPLAGWRAAPAMAPEVAERRCRRPVAAGSSSRHDPRCTRGLQNAPGQARVGRFGRTCVAFPFPRIPPPLPSAGRSVRFQSSRAALTKHRHRRRRDEATALGARRSPMAAPLSRSGDTRNRQNRACLGPGRMRCRSQHLRNPRKPPPRKALPPYCAAQTVYCAGLRRAVCLRQLGVLPRIKVAWLH